MGLVGENKLIVSFMSWSNNFTTLFNQSYLAKGLAMCKSMEKECDDFRLFLFAFDDVTAEVINKMGFKHVTVIRLKELEEYCPDLLKDKSNRNIAEYCWTCKGPSMQYCLDIYELDSICYLDSDLFFYNTPSLLFEESPSSDVLLTLHDFCNVVNLGESNGYHCAQYMAFKNNENGRRVLDWWTNLCLEWCYARHEKGRFGDQKYLDSFADHWEGTHDIKQGGCCGPWNIQRYGVVKEEGKIMLVRDGHKLPLVFYHFHFLHNRRYALFEELNFGPYKYSRIVRKIIYAPYIQELMDNEKRVRQMFPTVDVFGSEYREAPFLRQMYHLLKFFPKKNVMIWKRK